MKKKLEAELISIAHRVLKLKNRSETKQLQEEARKLYEQLTVLRFYEENFEAVKDEISITELENKLQQPTAFVAEAVVTKNEDKISKEEVIETSNDDIEEEPILKEDTIKEQPALFDGVLIDDYKEVSFVKVDEVPKEVEQVAEVSFEKVEEVEEVEAPVATTETAITTSAEPVIETIAPEEIEPKVIAEAQKEVVEEEPRTMSLNDRLTRGISFGLNDRIAFEKKLFGGNPDDFNRVISQLNTFDSFEEAKGFIDDFVKPDYNNWDGKEEFENRFLEIIERKFN